VWLPQIGQCQSPSTSATKVDESQGTPTPTVEPTSKKIEAPTNQYQFLKDYQTIVVGAFTFVIGILTVFNAIFMTWLTNRNRELDEKRKKVAFLAIMERDVEYIAEQLQTSTEIIKSIDVTSRPKDVASAGSWATSVRIASRISPLRSFEQEWEKLYMVGADNISRLREFDIVLKDINATFAEILSDQEAIRSQALPLFGGIIEDEEKEKANTILQSLEEQIDTALVLAHQLIHSVKSEFGERGRDGVALQR